jgi:hypothetical protein
VQGAGAQMIGDSLRATIPIEDRKPVRYEQPDHVGEDQPEMQMKRLTSFTTMRLIE